jgi:hypothetical protein
MVSDDASGLKERPRHLAIAGQGLDGLSESPPALGIEIGRHIGVEHHEPVIPG